MNVRSSVVASSSRSALTFAVIPYGKRRPAGTPLTWGEAMLAAIYVFCVMFSAYGVVPHQWLTHEPATSSAGGADKHLGPVGTKRRRSWQRAGSRSTINVSRPSATSSSSVIYGVFLGLPDLDLRSWWQKRGNGRSRPPSCTDVDLRPSAGEEGLSAWPAPTPTRRCPSSATSTSSSRSTPTTSTKAVKPKQFIHIDQSECIMCEGCVDICPWKCIHMVRSRRRSTRRSTPSSRATIPSDHVVFLIDDDVCTRCALCVDRCPTGRDHPRARSATRRPDGDPHQRTSTHGYALRHAALGAGALEWPKTIDEQAAASPWASAAAEADRARCRARRPGPRSSGPARSSARATPTAPGTAPT